MDKKEQLRYLHPFLLCTLKHTTTRLALDFTLVLYAQISGEALNNIRTIAGLGKEKTFVEMYEAQLDAPYQAALKKANVYGACYGFSQCIIFLTNSGSYRFGGYLVQKEGLHFSLVFR